MRLTKLFVLTAFLATYALGQVQSNQIRPDDSVQDSNNSSRISYSGYSIFRVKPQEEDQLKGLRKLRNRRLKGIDFLIKPGHVNQPIDIMVAPGSMAQFNDALVHLGLPKERTMDDVGETIKCFYPEPDASGDSRGAIGYQSAIDFYSNFQSYDNIEQRLQELGGSSSLISLEVAGSSFENRNLYLVKVSNDFEAEKPVIFVDGGHHAREWITHSTVMWLLESLVSDEVPINQAQVRRSAKLRHNCRGHHRRSSGPGARMEALDENKDFKFILDRFDVWIVPVVNPDGYIYSYYDRVWRKTRSVTNDYNCMGVDPNRNYDFHWGEVEASDNPCDNNFAGPYAHSEQEVSTVANLLKEHSDRIKMYISFHSYGQLILIPNAWDDSGIWNEDELTKVAIAGKEAFSTLRGTEYKQGDLDTLLYRASGGAHDYAYHSAGIGLSFTIELPDTGNYAFLLPPDEIMPVAREVSYALRAMADAIDLDTEN